MYPNNPNTNRILQTKKFIDENFAKDLSLDHLAEKAHCSPFHFQRIFKSIIGESPKQYIKRLRLEAAAHHLFLLPEDAMSKVTYRYGYSSLEAFSRAFKNHYTVSPDVFRKLNRESQIQIMQNNLSEKSQMTFKSLFDSSNVVVNSDLDIQIVKTTPRKLIYSMVTLKDEHTISTGFKKTQKWAQVRDLIDSKTEYIGLLYDFPAFTALDKCRFHTGIYVNEMPELSDDIYYKEIPSRVCASFTVKGELEEWIEKIADFAHQWLPSSGYDIIHEPGIFIPKEAPINRPLHDIPFQIYIGVKPK